MGRRQRDAGATTKAGLIVRSAERGRAKNINGKIYQATIIEVDVVTSACGRKNYDATGDAEFDATNDAGKKRLITDISFMMFQQIQYVRTDATALKAIQA